MDRAIEEENKATNDFMILDHVEGYDELPMKTQIYFRTAIQTWDADFYFKVDDDVFVSLGKRRVEHVWRRFFPSAGLRIAAFHLRRGCRAAWTDHFGLMIRHESNLCIGDTRESTCCKSELGSPREGRDPA